MSIYDLALQTWQDLNEPCDVTASYISGWFVNDVNIGRLNNTLNACFSGVDGVIEPELSSEENSIYSSLYKQNFYQKKIQENLGAGGIVWTTLRDGDGTITRASPTDVAKVYRDLLKDTNQSLRLEINLYKKNKAFPRSATFENP